MGNMLLIFVTIKIRKKWYISKYWIHTILLFYQGDFFSALRLAPTFVNLKSNTMKNTVQRYGFLANLQIFWVEKYVS